MTVGIFSIKFFLSRESLTASQKIGEREIEGKSGRRGESRGKKAGGHCLQPVFTPPFPLPSQAYHFEVLRPSAMNLHNGHANEVLGGRVLQRRTA
jgi:hypothetical protein